MDETSPWFPLAFAIPFIWASGWILVGFLRRHSAGRPLSARRPARATFFEKGASGRNLRTWYTRMSGASRCLVVTVVDDRLRIEVGFPINVMMPVDFVGLEMDIRLADIQAVERRQSLLMGDIVTVR